MELVLPLIAAPTESPGLKYGAVAQWYGVLGAVIFSAHVQPGSTVAVVGCVGVGLNVIMGAALGNASKVGHCRGHPGEPAGVRHEVRGDPLGQRRRPRPRRPSQGTNRRKRRPDYTFEVFGSSDTMKSAYDVCAKSGTATVVGMAPVGTEAFFNDVDIVGNEKTIRRTYYGSARSQTDMPKMANLYLSDKLNLDDLVVRHYTLDQMNEAYGDMDKNEMGRSTIMCY